MATMPSTTPKSVTFYRPGEYSPEESVGYLMRQVLSSVVNQADARLVDWDLTHAQWLPLFKLRADASHTVASLARTLDTDPGAMTRSLDRLEAKGLVVRERSTTDRRVVHLRLTTEGQRVADQVPPVLAGVLNGHLAGFTKAEWQTLLQLLTRMLTNGEAMRASTTPTNNE